MVARRLLLLYGLGIPLFASGIDYAAELDQRYAPYAEWAEQIPLEELQTRTTENWWRSPEWIRRTREESDLPLSGLHLALDPGHIGGEWAAIEGRDFMIEAGDFPVREGELVLEVARLVRADLLAMGAQVTLLRDKIAPVNPKPPEAYLSYAAKRVEVPTDVSWTSLMDYGLALKKVMARMAFVSDELIERARLVNEEIRPDALLSLHINAAPWPKTKEGEIKYELVDSNHTHVLIFGCLSDAELSRPLQREQMIVKMTNGSAGVERELGQALAVSLGEASALPPSNYSGKNAVRLEAGTPYLWARNLMLLRYVECPVVLLEPYIANSTGAYPRIQEAIRLRDLGEPPGDDDILAEYARAVVDGILAVYGPGD
ncbi:MAG TPA: hypothetical protein VJ952_12685 [Opitutales bacterium]|nr:hypothetical protein [Opitutales bacterium]